MPGPTLLEKLPLNIFRDDTDGGREEETEEEKDGFRDNEGPVVPNFCEYELVKIHAQNKIQKSRSPVLWWMVVDPELPFVKI